MAKRIRAVGIAPNQNAVIRTEDGHIATNSTITEKKTAKENE